MLNRSWIQSRPRRCRIALFILAAPLRLKKYSPDEDLDEEDEKFRIEFQRAIPEYPMLGRIWDTYINTDFKPEEVRELRDECLRVQLAAAPNAVASEGVRKIIDSCDRAINQGASLVFQCN